MSGLGVHGDPRQHFEPAWFAGFFKLADVMGVKPLLTIEEAANEIGCRSRNWLFDLLRKKAVLKHNNEAEPIYCHNGYFVVRDVEFALGKQKKTYKQTFVTPSGVSFIRGVICGAREKTAPMGRGNIADEEQNRKTETAGPGARTTQGLG